MNLQEGGHRAIAAAELMGCRAQKARSESADVDDNVGITLQMRGAIFGFVSGAIWAFLVMWVL